MSERAISVPELIRRLQIRTRRFAACTRRATSASITSPQPGENITRTVAGLPAKLNGTGMVLI